MGGGRIFYLDLIKCVGILLVIYGHVELFGFGIKKSIATDIIYTFNMPLFFFVSGFLAFKSHQTFSFYLSSTWKKISMLLIPSFIFSLFWALVRKTDVDFMEGFGKYWFGVTLLECFVIYYVVSIFTRKESQQLLVMTLFSIAGIGYLSTGAGDKYLAMIELNHFTKYLHFFTLGMFAKCFSRYYAKVLNCEKLRAIVLVSFFILLYILKYEGLFPSIVERFLNDILLRYLGLFVAVMFLYDVSGNFEANDRVVKFVGLVAENSFGIYLLQYFFLPDFRGQEWFAEIDRFSMFIICWIYSVISAIVCIGMIAVISRSNFCSHFVLGKR